MSFNKISIFLILLISFIIAGCNSSSPSENSFTPPKDKKITEKMADKYAKISVALTSAVEEEAAIIEDFRVEHNISMEMNELKDENYRREHPEVIEEWKSIQDNWKEKQKIIYDKYGMSEEEWDWIAHALIMPRNKPMQDYIRKEIERLEKEGFPEEKQTTGSK